MKDKIVITGGGTGGHLVPMLSIADSLKSDFEVVVYTGFEPLINKLKGFKAYRVKKILTGKIHRYHSLSAYSKNLLNIIKFFIGIIQAYFNLLLEKPKLIFSKGGYASLPTVIAGHALRIPIVIHESDITPGLANRIAIKYADKVGVSFPVENYNLPLEKIVYTGHVLRNFSIEKDIGRKLGLSNLPTLLVTGGSQGSLIINKCLAKILADLLEKMNVIHLCGEKDFSWLKMVGDNLKPKSGKYHLENFSPKILDYMAESDLILTRAGSNSLAEIAALRKPAIIIPYAYAAHGHQEDNANYVKKIGGGEVILEKDLTPDVLKEKIFNYISDGKKLRISGENAFKANSFEGTQTIKELIISMINERKK